MAAVREGCPIRCEVPGSDLAHLTMGDPAREYELESMRTLVTVGTAALADMDARYAAEEAERATRT